MRSSCYHRGSTFLNGRHDRLTDKILYMELDQQFLEQLVKALVDHPESVHVNRTVDEMGVLLTDRKSTRLNSSHIQKSRMPSSA